MKAQIIRFIAALLGSTLILSSATAHARDTTPATVGYIAAFRGLDTGITAADGIGFSHFNIAFANPAPDGNFQRDGVLTCSSDAGKPLTVDALRSSAERLRRQDAKILISVGGGLIPGCSGDWRALLTPNRRAATIAALVDLVDKAGLDGADIDIEGKLLTEIDRDGNYVPFIAGMSAAMKARDRLLTCATASYDGGMIPIGSIPYFDLVNVMSYDAIGPTWGTPGDEHASYAMAQRDLDMWLARGVARERLVLGVPFYGYGYGGKAPNWSFRDLAAAYPEDVTKGDTVGRRCADCAYITFNGPATIARKARLVREKAGGIMVWELSEDTADHQLVRAIRRGFVLH